MAAEEGALSTPARLRPTTRDIVLALAPDGADCSTSPLVTRTRTRPLTSGEPPAYRPSLRCFFSAPWRDDFSIRRTVTLHLSKRMDAQKRLSVTPRTAVQCEYSRTSPNVANLGEILRRGARDCAREVLRQGAKPRGSATVSLHCTPKGKGLGQGPQYTRALPLRTGYGDPEVRDQLIVSHLNLAPLPCFPKFKNREKPLDDPIQVGCPLPHY